MSDNLYVKVIDGQRVGQPARKSADSVGAAWLPYVVDNEIPDHDDVTERVTFGGAVEDGQWVERWTVEDKPLADAIADACDVVNARKVQREAEGFDIDVGGETYTVQTDNADPSRSMEKITGQGAWLAAGNPGDYDASGAPDANGTHILWTMSDNSAVLLATDDFMSLIANGARVLVRDCHIRGVALKTAIKACTDVAAVQTVLAGLEAHRATWTGDPSDAITGWPKAPV